MFLAQHRSLYLSLFIVLVQTLSLRSDAVSINKRDISNHIPVIATLIILDNNAAPTENNDFTNKKQGPPDSTKWHGLSSVNSLHGRQESSTDTQGATTKHTPSAIENTAASHMKESIAYERIQRKKYIQIWFQLWIYTGH